MHQDSIFNNAKAKYKVLTYILFSKESELKK